MYQTVRGGPWRGESSHPHLHLSICRPLAGNFEHAGMNLSYSWRYSTVCTVHHPSSRPLAPGGTVLLSLPLQIQGDDQILLAPNTAVILPKHAGPDYQLLKMYPYQCWRQPPGNFLACPPPSGSLGKLQESPHRCLHVVSGRKWTEVRVVFL